MALRGRNDNTNGEGQLTDIKLCVLTLLMVPISMTYDIIMFVKFRLKQAFRGRRKSHEQSLRCVQEQVRKWLGTDQSRPMCTARPAWMSVSPQQMSYKNRMFRVKIDMPNILSLDEDRRVVRVEPMVTIGLLNDYLMERGWMLSIVPELDDLTIGGLVMGGGIETTSKSCGLFQYTCKSYELVLGDASVIECNEREHFELFRCIPFSYGTFGFLTAVELAIVPYKPYIKLTYHPVDSPDNLVSLIRDKTNDDAVDALEGIVYSENKSVIITGTFVESKEVKGRINRIGRWYKPWFYSHVEKFLREDSSEGCFTEYIPTYDYYHRHNKALFWLLEKKLGFANHPIFRYTLGWVFPIKFSLLKRLWATDNTWVGANSIVVQDFVYPLSDLKEVLKLTHEKADIYPLWLCPFITKEVEVMENGDKIEIGSIYVDVGIYGVSSLKNFDNDEYQKTMEQHCMDRGGAVALYAETLLTRAQLYKMFYSRMRYYDELRKRYFSEKAFPHIYDKISKAARN